MAALSSGTYGKEPTMDRAELADRITAVLENAYEALDTLDHGNQTGAVADQGAINTLRKVVQDFGTIAGDARKAASDEAAKAHDEKVEAAAPKDDTTAAADTSTSGTAKGGSGTSGGSGSSKS
jgi:hypothetical protein